MLFICVGFRIPKKKDAVIEPQHPENLPEFTEGALRFSG
jgi:hypothetical protein